MCVCISECTSGSRLLVHNNVAEFFPSLSCLGWKWWRCCYVYTSTEMVYIVPDRQIIIELTQFTPNWMTQSTTISHHAARVRRELRSFLVDCYCLLFQASLLIWITIACRSVRQISIRKKEENPKKGLLFSDIIMRVPCADVSTHSFIHECISKLCASIVLHFCACKENERKEWDQLNSVRLLIPILP